MSTTAWLLNICMLQELVRQPSALYVYWTLPLELAIYGAFSLLYVVRLQLKSGWMVAAMLAAFALSGAFRVAHGQNFGFSSARLVFFAPLMGLLAYRYVAGQSGPRPMIALALGQAALFATGHLAEAALGLPADEQLRALVKTVTWVLAYSAFFVAFANRRRRMPASLAWVGKISYSLYLLHILAMTFLLPLGLPAWAYFPALFGTTLLVAGISYRLIEAPSIALGRALERRLLPQRPLTPVLSETRRAA
jgi:peptidoglycan/LPS O-acetylase OafA/YrhL